MATENSAVETLRDGTREAARQASPWVERLARFGYAARGTVYVTIALLALQAAGGRGDASPNSDDALRTLVAQPFGVVLVALLAVGLLGYSIWRCTQATFDPERRCRGRGGPLQRIGFVIGALTHGAIAISAIRLVLGSQPGDQDQASKDWTASIIAHQYGAWLIGMIGFIILGVGLWQLYCAFKRGAFDQIQFSRLKDSRERWVKGITRFGQAARAIVFGVIGILLLEAAFELNPQKAEGFGGALQTLARQPYGPWLLVGAAVGLLAYGFSNLLMARYRDIPTPGPDYK